MRISYGISKQEDQEQINCYISLEDEIAMAEDPFDEYVLGCLEYGAVGLGDTKEVALWDWKYQAREILDEYEERLDAIREKYCQEDD